MGKKRFDQSPFPPFTNKEGLSGLEAGLRTGLPNFTVHRVAPSNLVSATAGAETVMQHYARNFTSELVPTKPLSGSAWKDAYALYRTLYFPLVVSSAASRLVWKTYTATSDSKENDRGVPLDDYSPWYEG